MSRDSAPSAVPAALAAARALVATWRGRFILAWLVAQALLPLLYYAARHDPHDERFAWRMFSPMRMITCDPKFMADGAELDLSSRFHEGWLDLAHRGRYAVIEAMGARLCAEQPGRRIDLRMTCTRLDGTVDTWPGYDICTVTDL